jgi:molybdate transport system substrate-binding protein
MMLQSGKGHHMTMRTRTRRGGANNVLVLLVGSFVVLGILSALLVWNARSVSRNADSTSDSDELFLFCASGLRYAIEPIAADYEREYDQPVRIQYGGSNTLLSNLEAGRTGDLFLPGDDSYLQLASEKGILEETIPLATMHPVVAVQNDCTLNISSIRDLIAPDVRVACATPDAAAIGKMTRRLLTASGDWQAWSDHVTVFKPTVNDVANDVKLGSVDAGIVWDSTVAQYPELKGIPIPELVGEAAHVAVGILNWSDRPTASLKFARYIAARDKGLAMFAKTGFSVVEGDVWDESPEITFFAGSVNRRAVAPIVEAFERREGVTVNTVYNGCGILTGQMKSIMQDQSSGFPDVYMACDVYYLETVKDWFQDAVNVSDTEIVIVVQEGNPKQIETLDDLLKPGVRVSIGQPEQCTIGVLTRRLLEHAGIYDQLLKENVVNQTATSALLVPAVTTGSADAVLAYRTDTLAEQDKIDAVPIDSKLARAIQPFSVARSSQHKQLGRRLFRAIANSQDSFESAGFRWRLDVQNRSASDAKDREGPVEKRRATDQGDRQPS